MTQMLRMIALSLSLILCSCAPNISGPLPTDATGRMQLDSGYALLYDLMKEEAKVAEILKIKHADPDLAQLLEDISAVSKDAVKQLDAYQTEDPSLKMNETYLPAVEVSSRNSIKNTTTVDLLLPGKQRFRTLMLVSQFSAMRYGRYIALSLRTADTSIPRSHWLRGLASKLSDLQTRSFKMLESPAALSEGDEEPIDSQKSDDAPNAPQ